MSRIGWITFFMCFANFVTYRVSPFSCLRNKILECANFWFEGVTVMAAMRNGRLHGSGIVSASTAS